MSSFEPSCQPTPSALNRLSFALSRHSNRHVVATSTSPSATGFSFSLGYGYGNGYGFGIGFGFGFVACLPAFSLAYRSRRLCCRCSLSLAVKGVSVSPLPLTASCRVLTLHARSFYLFSALLVSFSSCPCLFHCVCAFVSLPCPYVRLSVRLAACPPACLGLSCLESFTFYCRIILSRLAQTQRFTTKSSSLVTLTQTPELSPDTDPDPQQDPWLCILRTVVQMQQNN